VYSVDIQPEFTANAGRQLAAAGITNVTLDTGDAARGWDKQGPVDVIMITGSLPLLPDAFPSLLKPGGRLIAVVGQPPAMQTRLITCALAGEYATVTLFETCIPPLKNALQPQRFVF
jgi:protein-L-isoaspartate(D-aspartate) O-methyltransferase